MKCVAQQFLRSWLEIISIYIEINFLDIEVIMEAELNEFKHVRKVTCKCSKEKQLIEFEESWTLMMKFGIFGKTMTWYEKTLFRKVLVVLCESVENNLMASELDYELENHCSRGRTEQKTDTDDNKSGVLRKTTTFDDKLKRPVVRLAPLFYERVFREKKQVRQC